MEELYELVRSAGAEPVASAMQKRPAPDAAYCVGSGLLEEILETCQVQEIDLLVFDRELSPTQIRNIEDKSQLPGGRPYHVDFGYFCPAGPEQRRANCR